MPCKPALKFCALFGLALTALAGCDQDQPARQTSQMSLSPPSMLRAYDADDLTLSISVDGEQVEGERNVATERWTANFKILSGRRFDLEVLWRSRSLDIDLAGLTRSLGPVQADITYTFNDSDYRTDYHCDNDGYTNLEELEINTDPCDPASPSTIDVDVRIPRIEIAEAPVIDGQYDDIWHRSVFTDTNHETLAIDNLMIGTDPLRSDNDTEFQWSALHDGTYLYIFAHAENVGIATSYSDSSVLWGDDTLEIFVDGDNSKLQSYDGVDDRQILIPLLKFKPELEANNSIDSNSRYIKGSNSAPIDDIVSFSNCFCSTDRHTFEIRIDLEKANIRPGRPFGLEFQYDDDQNGRGRDAKWGWIHPSKTDEDIDLTWEDPSLMGIAVLD